MGTAARWGLQRDEGRELTRKDAEDAEDVHGDLVPREPCRRGLRRRHEWRELVRKEAEDVRGDLVPFVPCNDSRIKNRIQHICWLLARAENAAATPSRFSDWWRGSLQERAWSTIHQAWVEVIELLEKDEDIRARAREIVIKARETLPSNDPRLQEVSSALSPLGKRDGRSPTLLELLGKRDGRSPTLLELRPAMAYLAGAAYRQADKQYAQSRSFRNRLIRLTCIALAVDVLVLVAGVRGGLFEVRVNGSNATRTTLLIALFGTIGAFLSSVQPLARNQGIRNPFNLPLFQLLLKLALGPLFAVIGVAMISSQTTQMYAVMMSPLHLLVWATGFGMVQQAVTRQVDQRVRGLLAPTLGPL